MNSYIDINVNGLLAKSEANADQYEQINGLYNYFWYSPSVVSKCRPNSQQLLDSAVDKWTSNANISVAQMSADSECRDTCESRPPVKRTHYSATNACEADHKRGRSCISHSHYSYNSPASGSDSLRRRDSDRERRSPFRCSPCGAYCYSYYDFKSHLKGSRHASNTGMQAKPRFSEGYHSSAHFDSESSAVELQHMLDTTSEPVIGLDFVREILDKLNGMSFYCSLCYVRIASVSSMFQHILGFKHRFNYIKLIDAREANTLLDIDKRPRKHSTELARNIAYHFESRYGRGRCKFVDNRSHNAVNAVVKVDNYERLTLHQNVDHMDVKQSNPELMDTNFNFFIDTLKEIKNLCENKITEFEALKQSADQSLRNDRLSVEPIIDEKIVSSELKSEEVVTSDSPTVSAVNELLNDEYELQSIDSQLREARNAITVQNIEQFSTETQESKEELVVSENCGN